MFGFGRKKFLGIDIGASTLKIVELEMRGDRPYLLNYAWMRIPDIYGKNSDAGSGFFETAIPEYLKRIIKESEFNTNSAYLSIPSFGGLITLIDFPEMSEKDMEQAIRFEAHKYIPTSLDEVVISWEVVNGKLRPGNTLKKVEGGENVQVLLVAASKKKILTYEKIAKDTNLKLKGIEMENLSMVDSLIGNDEGNFIIIDIGFHVCNIVYIEKRIIKANRNIDAGGADLTRTIAKSLDITFERAEAMKISGKIFFTQESNLHFSALDMIAEEANRIIETLSADKNNLQVDAIILSGGTANLVGLKEFFQEKLNTKTVIGNPFSRIKYDKKLEPAIEKIKSQFSVCVGLALKGVKENARKK